MSSTTRSRPSHYEALRLKPTATADEIAAAFARELRRPQPFGGIAQVSIAYETLRDPAKRRAYDVSIGIKPPPQPSLAFRLTAPAHGTRFVGTATPKPLERPVGPLLSSPAEPHVEREPQAESPLTPVLPSFLASSLRNLARPEPLNAAASAPQPQAEQRTNLDSEGKPKPQADRIPGQAREHGLPDAEEGSVDWKRTGSIIGGLVATAGIFGIWAGSQAASDIQPDQPQRVTRTLLPPAKPIPDGTIAAAASELAVLEAPLERSAPTAVATAGVAEASPSRPQPLVDFEQQTLAAIESSPTQPEASQTADAATDQAVAEPMPAAAVAAAMPLPNRVIARTIERIGYACGQVASTAAVDGGAPGVFKVTCTSGQAYQAKPVGGRYRFRRWGRP